jgi:hypothetical protein
MICHAKCRCNCQMSGAGTKCRIGGEVLSAAQKGVATIVTCRSASPKARFGPEAAVSAELSAGNSAAWTKPIRRTRWWKGVS